VLSQVQDAARPSANPAVPSVAPLVSHCAVVSRIADAEKEWRALEGTAILSPYQRYDWMRCWQDTAGAAQGVKPLIVIAFDRRGEPVALMPLGHTGSRRARFLGGKHANFNFGPWPRQNRIGRSDLDAMLCAVARHEPHLAVLELINQPEAWGGMPNPLLDYAHQPSPSPAHRLTLGSRGEQVLKRQLSANLRGKLRNRERKLAAFPDYRFFIASTPAEVDRCLEAFFRQKANQFAAEGIENVFAEPGAETFFRAACLAGLESGRPLIEIFAVEGNGEVLGLFAGTGDGERISMMISSHAGGDYSRNSPGLIALAHCISTVADRGYAMFDLGVGDASYKTSFCDGIDTLFDSFLPLNASGQILARALAVRNATKRVIKNNPTLWRAAQAIRQLRGR
jgi:CelD/BcsL family acetyltransferase involved in cellulose biosynthesis